MNESKDFPMKCNAIVLVPNTNEGFFAALGIKSYLKKQGLTPAVIRIRPCQLEKINLANDLPIYISGLGKKNCHPNSLNNFVEKFENRIAFWADNHPGYDHIKILENNKYYFHTLIKRHPSCLSFLKEIWGSSIIKEEWVEAANFLETKLGKENAIAETYKKLMYVGRTEDSSGQKENLRNQFEDFYSDFLLSGKKETKEIFFFMEQYDKIIANTKEAINSLNWSRDFPDQILICNAEGQVDKELIIAAANKLSEKYLLVIQHKDFSENFVTTMIATKPELIPATYQKNVATRVFIPGDHQEVLRDIYQSLIPSFHKKLAETSSAMV